MIEGPQIVAAADATSVQEELKAYLRDRSLALVISSYGEGRPEMLVYDPGGLLSWFPQPTSEEPRSAMSGAFSSRRATCGHLLAPGSLQPPLP